MNYRQNNLARATSPYLRQHANNPVWWQEWNTATLEFARNEGKPLFVSVGYATCHWCHVMAAEAFSDPGVAAYLNEHFVSIKIDREERPDIDHYLMQFLLATRGNGGWPLNVFLAAPRRPVAALTYVPVEPRAGMPGFVDIAGRVVSFLAEKKDHLQDIELPFAGAAPSEDEGIGGEGDSRVGERPAARNAAATIAANLVRRADREFGGFGMGAKFPPHSTLLFLLHYGVDIDIGSVSPGATTAAGDATVPHRHAVDEVITETLNAMALGGLHDHLQGGFFRYCIDRAWTVPHFEKMLYDQAMLLWVYALGWHRYGNELYRYVAESIVTALEETFRDGELYVSAHDADTDHVEGATYLWSDDELHAVAGECEGAAAVGPEHFFYLPPGGTVEGMYHLTRRAGDGAPNGTERDLLSRMLARRRGRRQPDVDRKVVTAWNALTGVALVVAGRYLNRPDWIDRARDVRNALLQKNGAFDTTETEPAIRLVRSTLEGRAGGGEFLEDYGAFLLLETHLLELNVPGMRGTTSSAANVDVTDTIAGRPAPGAADHEAADGERPSPSPTTLPALERKVLQFYRDGKGWLLSLTEDFPAVPADEFDAPTPSAMALAEYALLRSAQIRNSLLAETPGAPPIEGGALRIGPEQARDFHNIAALFSAGEIPVLHRSTPIEWNCLPPGAMQLPSEHDDWCFRFVCYPGDPPF